MTTLGFVPGDFSFTARTGAWCLLDAAKPDLVLVPMKPH